MFELTKKLLGRYNNLMEKLAIDGFNSDLSTEVTRRLMQLDYLLEKIEDAERRDADVRVRSQVVRRQHAKNIEQGLLPESALEPPDSNVTREELKVILDASFEIEIYTECFYYLAGRIRTILTHKERPLPGLEKFEAVGIRDVRNQLLEHPEGSNSRVFSNSFGYGGPCGPKIKELRDGHQEDIFPDKGLYINAAEMRDRMENLIKRVLKSYDQPIDDLD